MPTQAKRRKSTIAWGRSIVPTFLAILNTVFISVLIPDLGVIIALAQWLHTFSAEKKGEMHSLQEENAQTGVSIIPAPAANSPGAVSTPNATAAGSSSTGVMLPDEGERVDMGEAPHVEHFYGRVDEIARLKRWIVDERCRLVSIIGVGGVGKTSLVAKLVDQELHDFSVVFWRSLLNAPPLERILQECLQFLTRAQQIGIPQDREEQMRLLVKLLQKQRCLLILDNAEAILKSGSSTAEYKDGNEGYGTLIRLLGESRHQSCLLVTSREQPREIAWLEGEGTSVHTYRLRGLSVDDARVMLEKKGLSGEERSWQVLVERFSGNPIMLMITSSTIRESYRGHVSQYLAELGDTPLNEHVDLRALLESQFQRLSLLEQHVIYWLAVEREAVSLQDLRNDSVQPVSKGTMLSALEALQRRSLIEQSGIGNFTLQPAMMEAVTDRFTELVVQEIITGKAELFASHALLKAQAKDYIRRSQFQLILNVIVQKLFTIMGRTKLEEKFRQRLVALRNLPEPPNNYEAGNILNMLAQTGYDLRGFDFSRLVIRQAYLQEVELLDVNFAHANLATAVFTDTFGSILSVALSPQGDLLAAGTVTGEIRLWHAISGLPLQTLRGHSDWVKSVAFSPDGKTLASASEDWTVRLWEVSSGKCLTILRGHINAVLSVAFSPDGKMLASGSDDRAMYLWEVSSSQCLTILRGHNGPVKSVAFSADGKMLASGSDDRTAHLWEVNSGRCLTILQGHTDWVCSVAFSADGKMLASGSEDRTVRLWEVSGGQCLNTLHSHTSVVLSVIFSPDGKILASGSGSEDHSVRLWEVSSGQCFTILQGHTGAVRSVVYSPDGKMVISGSEDRTVRLWEVSSGQCLTILYGYTNAVFSVAFSPTSEIFASGSNDRAVRLWEVSSNQCLTSLQVHNHRVWSVAFSADGKMLASGSEDRTARLWEVNSNQRLTSLQGHTDAVWSVAFSPDGKTLASGSKDRTVRLWEVSSGQCLTILQGHTSIVRAVAFSPDGKMLASGSEDGTVRLWEMSSSQCLIMDP